MSDMRNLRENIIPNKSHDKFINNCETKSGLNLPDNGYLRFFGLIALIVAVLMFLGSIGNEDKNIIIAGIIIFFLGIIIIGIGTLIVAINCNSEISKSKR